MSRRLLFTLPVVAMLASCGSSNTGFLLQITVNPDYQVPADYDSVFVQVVPQQSSGGAVNDNTTGQTFPLTTQETQPYVILVLETNTQYTEATQISVQLMKGSSTFQGESLVGDTPITQGQLTTVVMPEIH